MGILNRLFGSTGSIAEKSVKDEEVIAKAWKDYVDTVPKKEDIINKLPYLFGERKAHLQKLIGLLKSELVDIKIGEKEEDDLISNIHAIEHSKKIRRADRLEDCLRYINTRYEYVHALLFHLYALLKSEANIAEKMKNSDIRKYRKLNDKLKSELAVEKTILAKINDISTFHQLLIDLVKGEKIIATMDSSERKLYKKMSVEMGSVLSGKLNRGVLYNLTGGVFNAIKYKVHNAIGNAPKIKPESIYAYHDSVDFEYVNRSEFVTLVRQIIKIQKITDVMSEQSIKVFVHLFREWYNHERR
ncbi:hypothetical protein HYU06_01365 [Candidatus Woesearchaeota archaeon]|nr:hypothetical protein [Candidatus Woesearchaeota archaeon]